ncbi:C40 family peptidase [Catelliglobosispora koreensis]|uniref:C40 family peptidase n=1 Tax=Catelliglobosispora koreensis TaxID=129052 RepID=UPI00036FB003|nr:C40 family peptidase [Catelliglobosispora koreensis]
MCSHLTRRRPLAARTTLLTVLSTLALLFGFAGHAYADPTPAEIEAQIDAKWNQIEPTVEEHNAVRIKLDLERKKADELTAKLKPLEDEVATTRTQVGIYADYLYRGGTLAGIGAMLDANDPTVFAERLQSMDQVARHFNGHLDHVLATKKELDEAKKPLDAIIAQLDALEKEQAARIQVIKDEIAKLDQLRLKAYANGGGIGELAPVPCPTTYPGGAAGTAIKYACAQIGRPYVFAADGPDSFDCSGLTKSAWLAAGVSLPHNAKAQRGVVASVSRSELRPGDLVFYYSDLHHVGMYAGDGWIVHASRPGVPVKMRKMDSGGNIHSYGRPG